MNKHDRSPLTLTEASQLLQELDKQRKQGRITGIAYRNRRERLLSRIMEAPPQPLDKKHRYLTRRQLQLVMPAPAPRPPPLEHGHAALDLYRKKAEKEAMDEFIVHSSEEGDTDDDDISIYQEEEEKEKEFIEPMLEERREPVTTKQQTEETEAQREHREKMAQYESVKISFRPMFPEKRAKVIDIDFVGSLPNNNERK